MANTHGFSATHDYFGFAATKAVCTKSAPNKGTSYQEGVDENGDIVQRDIYGKSSAPNCEYVLKADLAGSDFPELGGVVATPEGSSDLPIAVSNVTVNTAAGQPPSIQISGVGVEPGAIAAERTFDLSIIGAVLKRHKAQILAGAFTLSGTGCHVLSCSCSATASINPTPVAGTPVSSDCFGGVIEVTAQIACYGEAAPTISAAGGFELVSDLSPTDGDTEYTTYNIVCRKELTLKTGA